MAHVGGRLKQEDQEFKVNLGYVLSLRLALATLDLLQNKSTPPPKKRIRKRKEKQNKDTIFSKTKLKFVSAVFCTLPILMSEQRVP